MKTRTEDSVRANFLAESYFFLDDFFAAFFVLFFADFFAAFFAAIGILPFF